MLLGMLLDTARALLVIGCIVAGSGCVRSRNWFGAFAFAFIGADLLT